MENQKSDFLRFSQDFKDLVTLCYKNKNLDLENASINFSKVSANDLENSSLITGMDGFVGLGKIDDTAEHQEYVHIDKGMAARSSL